jgi:hypothetical protein
MALGEFKAYSLIAGHFRKSVLYHASEVSSPTQDGCQIFSAPLILTIVYYLPRNQESSSLNRRETRDEHVAIS